MSQKKHVDTNHLGSKYKTVDPSPVEKSLERLELLFASRMYLITLVYITIKIWSQPSLICGEKLQVNHYHINLGITLKSSPNRNLSL